MMDIENLADEVSKAMRKAWNLGQTYWSQADSESYSQNKKSDDTAAKFNELVDATRESLRQQLAKPAVEWISVIETMPEKRIRVIAGIKNYVIGDCYFGKGNITKGRVNESGYLESKQRECWRHTKSDEQLEDEPTHWQPLPNPPAAYDALQD
jgi:hypothetical protein